MSFAAIMFGYTYRRYNFISIAVILITEMYTQKRHRPKAKIWLEFNGASLLGEGGAEILEAIKKEKSISKAARTAGMSYRYVWNYLAKIEKNLGKPIVKRFKGGKAGGGGAELNTLGQSLLKEYKKIKGYVGEILCDEEYWEAVGLKISARNRLKGVVKSVKKGDIVAKVKVELSIPAVITALISTEAVNDLKIKTGDNVEAVIKATEVMIAKEK
ncbi:MAG: TOBE domain-containing protein [Candidatus Bathyarchaeales archaeon]